MMKTMAHFEKSSRAHFCATEYPSGLRQMQARGKIRSPNGCSC